VVSGVSWCPTEAFNQLVARSNRAGPTKKSMNYGGDCLQFLLRKWDEGRAGSQRLDGVPSARLRRSTVSGAIRLPCSLLPTARKSSSRHGTEFLLSVRRGGNGPAAPAGGVASGEAGHRVTSLVLSKRTQASSAWAWAADTVQINSGIAPPLNPSVW